MAFFTDWLTVFVVGTIAIITPGPDFALTLRSSLVHSKKAGLYTAIGVGAGNTVHATYSLVGIGAILSQSILFFSLLKWAGAAYLIFLGMKSLRAKKMTVSSPAISSPMGQTRKKLTRWAAFRIGFFGNLLNPKATLFFLALFTQIVRPSTPMVVQAVYGVTVAVLSLLWFAFIAVIISRKAFKDRILASAHWLERATGVALIGLGFRLAATEASH